MNPTPMPRRPSDRPGHAPARATAGSRDAWLAAASLVALVAAVYGRTLAHGFVPWDDPDNLYESAELARPLAGSIAAVWTRPVFASYLPVTRTVWTLLWHVTHAPAAFHALNLVVHALNVLLAFRLLRRVVPGVTPAAVGAALFAVHPFQVEPVAWATGLKDLLGATFSLVALERFAMVAGAWAARPARATPRGAIVLATAAYALALLAKASSAAVPLMAIALAWTLGAPRLRALFAGAVGIAMALPVAWVTRAAERATGRPFVVVAPLDRPRVALDALGFYLTRLVAPFDLTLDHGRTPGWVLAHPGGWAMAALVMALAVAVAVGARRHPRLALAAAWFALALLPVLGLTPFLHQNISTVADRYAYLAMLGPALALALAWRVWPARPARVAMLVALVACAAASVALVPSWRDGQALFAHVLARTPSSWMAHNNRGVASGQAGHTAEAEADLRAALAVMPGLPEAHNNLGNVEYLLGRPDSAASEWRRAIALLPTLASAQRNLGQLLASRGDTARAIVHLREAARLVPGDTVASGALRALGAGPGTAPPH